MFEACLTVIKNSVYNSKFSGSFNLGTQVSSTNRTDRHDITEIVESGVKHHKPKP